MRPCASHPPARSRAFDALEELALLGDPTQRLALHELVGVAVACGAPCHAPRKQLWR